MSNYLADVAARSLGLVAVAQPRLGSRFEPVMPEPTPVVTPKSDAEMSTFVDASDRVPIAAAPAPIAAIDHRDHARDTSDRIEVQHERREGVEQIRPLMPKTALQPVPELPIAIGPRIPEGAPAPIARHEVVIPPRVATDEASPVRAAVTLERRAEHAAPLFRDSERWRNADDRLSALERGLAARDNTRAPSALPRVEPIPQSIAPRSVVHDQPPQQAPRSVHRVTDDAAPADVPAVHVTIGRIDVRAITPAPSARLARRHAPRPSLSLDEYLKQRSS